MIEKKKILVIGDVMLDTYFSGDVTRISPEAPVPVFRKKEERSVLGGAANVAANLVAAGQEVSMLSMIGDDDVGVRIKDILESQRINTDLIIPLNRKTTEKTRFLASNNQQVLRLDVEDTDELSSEECKLFIELLTKKIQSFDLILLSDYLKGLLTYEFTQTVIKLANRNNIPIIVDVKDPKSEKYDNATLLKPNLKELHDLTRMNVETKEEIIVASNSLRERRNVKYVLTTCGGRGMVLVGEGEPLFIEAYGQEVFDVTGAGDTTIAYLGACMANGFDMNEAVRISNVAAGIQVSKVGTSSVRWEEIKNRIGNYEEELPGRLLTNEQINSFRTEHQNDRIVFTNGCFDILHVGHIRYLKEAAKLGDIIVIGLNSDDSVKRLKGLDRPVNNELERAEMLCALSFVDYVAIFDEDTPIDLIYKICPDVLVKGGDYTPDKVVGKDFVEAQGGELKLIPFVEGKSTTNIINKIKK